MLQLSTQDLTFKAFAAASGPGGQHVNKVATAIELRCPVAALGLPEAVRERLVEKAGSRLTQSGELVIVSKEHRSQERNRMEAMQKLVDLVLEAIELPEVRKATKPTRASVERRVGEKKARGALKANRRVGE